MQVLGVDSRQGADLATNALGMAIDSREPAPGAVIHGDHGTQFTCWSFTERARRAGALPSLETVSDPYDNAVIESFWGRMQTELLTASGGPPGWSWPTRSSSTSRASTTAAGVSQPSVSRRP